ncbi:MAG: hypothetical protein GX643_03625 [Acidimicrobiales bacterium]|nr:hypothetical protein [Acidimicrobiales bacterium]
MLLVFGFKIRLSTTASLVFFCPSCGGDRAGSRRSARRWFTLFWIPVVPLKSVGEVVECETCHTRFDPTVADRPTTADLHDVLSTAVRVLNAMLVRTAEPTDGPAAEAIRNAAVAQVRTAIPEYDHVTLSSDVASLDPALAGQYVGPLDEGLAVGGKELLLSDLVRVTLAGGTITPDQRRVIDHAGRGLGLTPAHVTGIVTSVVAARTAEPG